MTHDDLYPCPECGRENLYPGPCESCRWDQAAVIAAVKPAAVELGKRIETDAEFAARVRDRFSKPRHGTAACACIVCEAARRQ